VIERILIRIKADVIDSVALDACSFKPLRWSWGFNNTMAMQDDYKVSVTTRRMQVYTTYYFDLSSYHLSKSVEYRRGYRGLVVLLTHKQLEQHGDFTQSYLGLLSHWVDPLMMHLKRQYIHVSG
jgi:hypothetical protein